MQSTGAQTWFAAMVGAHVKTGGRFRPRDVKFLIELFANWQTGLHNPLAAVRVHNTQLKRELEKMVAENWAVAKRKKGPAHFQLTRAGLIRCLTGLKEEGLHGPFTSFLFCRYFLLSYGERLARLITSAEAPLPLAVRNEIQELVSVAKLQKEKEGELRRQIHYWEDRIRETEGTVAFVKDHLAAGEELAYLVPRVESLFPYELNYQKPLRQLLSGTPEDLQIWELTEGNALRIKILWRSYLAILRAQLAAFESSSFSV